MKSKMKSSVKEKLDNDARRKVGKIYGFKQHSWCNWIIKDGDFLYAYKIILYRDANIFFSRAFFVFLVMQENLAGNIYDKPS